MKAHAQKKSAPARTRRTITQLLKQEGPLDAATLAARLGLTAMAVRQHLYALQDEKLVTYEEAPRPVGRPAKLWQLTSAADRLFPEAYAELTLSLITSVTKAFGKAGLEQLLAMRTREQIETYRRRILDRHPTAQRLETLAGIRTEEGYMAEVQVQEDGTFLLLENHCPICVAATAYTGLCAQELDVFQAVLGSDVSVERIEHLVAGARRCVYRVASREMS